MTRKPAIALYFEPPTHHFLGDRLFERSFAGHAGDQILEPYAFMRDHLLARGVTVHTADFMPAEPDDVCKIYVSSGRLNRYQRLVNRKDVVLSAFFALECPTVEPAMYRDLRDAQRDFKRVFSWSDSASLEPFVGGPLRCLPLKWPQSFDGVHEAHWSKVERKFLVMLNSNKLPRYETPCRELYSERMRAIEFFAREHEIDLYGNGWDGPTYRVGQWTVPGTFGKVPMPGTAQFAARWLVRRWQQVVPEPRLMAARKVYRGFAPSKSETLAGYRFSLCFENSILKGWITEKIFDCFFAGTVPVYWGAPDVEEHIPPECFIDMRGFKDYQDLRTYLKSLTGSRVQRFKTNARDFIESPQFVPFSKQAFAEMFGRIVEQDAGVSLEAAQPVRHA